MATGAPADLAADLLQNLSIDSQAKTVEVSQPTKKPTTNKYGSVDSNTAANGQIQPHERSVTPLLSDGYSCYYGGYGDIGTDYYSTYVNPNGIQMTSGAYGDNGSVMYHYGYGFSPYGTYSPAGPPFQTMGNGQLYGPQHYQYPSHFKQLTPTSAPFTPSSAAPPPGEVSTSAAADQKPSPLETSNGSSNVVADSKGLKGNNGSAFLKPTYDNSLTPGSTFYGYQDPRFAFDGLSSPVPWLDAPPCSQEKPKPAVGSTITSSISNVNNLPSSKNQNFYPSSHFMGLHHPKLIPDIGTAYGLMNNMYTNKLYGHYGNTVRYGMGIGYGSYNRRTKGNGYLAVDSKQKPRGRGNGFFGYGNDTDGLNELNKGPRGKAFNNQKESAPITSADKGQNLQSSGTNDEKDNMSVIPDREQYNRPDFLEECTDAKFFIIKSYSEDDVHKSIKYNVWASTPYGNKKLHAEYQEAQEKSVGCPVFLFFSVNTSGQFVGLAEMVGPVDFDKNLEYWQQDKWKGCFPVKWHIVKDVPNSLLKHITVENNDNKPVTNSRDTQEVKLEPGLKMIKIFKEHSSRTCILDDFRFYEVRQKTVQEKKSKQQQFQRQVQVGEGKPTDEKKEDANGELETHKQMEVASDLIEEPTPSAQTNEDLQLSESSSAAKTGDAKPVESEKRTAENGVENSC